MATACGSPSYGRTKLAPANPSGASADFAVVYNALPMDLLALAVPFFLLAFLVELAVDRVRGTGFIRASDAINSMSAGSLMTTIGYFTGLIPAAILAYVLRDVSLLQFDLAAFDLSPSGIVHWAIALVAFDFCYYWRHRFGHTISILWAAHAVHHQSEDYNLSTALRQTASGDFLSWIFYVPLFVLGMPFEVYAIVNALDLIYQFWVHTRHIRRLGWMEKVFVTPSNHRVHHAQNQIYIDKNYGGIFIFWDRLFGTFQDELDSEPVVFGVRKPLQSWNPFWANLQVYDYLLFDAVRTRRWRDKLGIWFRRTGWRPADMSEKFPKRPTELSAFQKYDPELVPGVQRYTVIQFIVAILQIVWIGMVYSVHGLQAVILPCLLFWTLLFSIGMLNDGKRFAPGFEMFRLFVVMPAGLYGILQGIGSNWPQTSAWMALALYALVSAALLKPAWKSVSVLQ
jgi:sterol desaturase/sphingolipid hydroxylase (fatty acid hydroxylase superfamily)